MISLSPLTGILRSLCAPGARKRRQSEHTVNRISELTASLHRKTDLELVRGAQELRELVRQVSDPSQEETLITGFAIVCEAARRSIGISFFGVQIQAGIALARRSIAEMATGEGKTFVAAFPAFLYGLTGRGVHVMTVNAYLAERDHALLSPLFQFLGMSTGLLRRESSGAEKKAAYQADVTYGPGYEFGFDYLRDQLAVFTMPKPRLGDSVRNRLDDRAVMPPQPAQRGQRYAIVDEADSVMIDEATMPLILAGCGDPRALATGEATNPSDPAESLRSQTVPHPRVYLKARQAADQLVADQDYITDTDSRTVRLTDCGVSKINTALDVNVRCGLERPWQLYVEQALYASLFLKSDVDYIVQNGQVMLVDQFTGRIFSERTLRDGLHQAVEAREGLEITAEHHSLARISRQRFFRLYDGLCGMTGTATGSERELREVYGLTVVPIATHRPCRRVVLPTRYFVDEESKRYAIGQEIARLYRTGQPVLAGTRTIEKSELLARRLQALEVPFCLLNGKQDEAEAAIVARAGQLGSVTIATNMAGRGTDIKLGAGVAELGGLHVIGTERHESARVDRQLAGRAARQGDPGSCQFFVSADDILIRRHAPRLGDRLKESAGVAGEIAVDLDARIANLQKQAEQRAFEHRRRLFARDDWLEKVMSRLAAEVPRCSA